jgi:hypothetical protein
VIHRYRSLPLFAAAWACGYGTGWWLSEWLWRPGNDATDLIVFQAFAVNFLVLMPLAWRSRIKERS